MRKLAPLALLTALACQPEPGSARLEFVFADDAPPLTATVFVFARIEDGDGLNLGGVGPVSLAPNQDTLDVQPINVPNGSDRVAIVEIREGSSASTQVLYYGISAPFAIEPGKVTDVVINVSLQTPPVGGDVTIEGAGTGTVAFIRSPDVSLVLLTDTAFRAQISNFVDLPEEECGDTPTPCSVSVNLQNGEVVPGQPGVSRYTVPWSMNRGLDDDCVEQDYCPRYVFVRFFDRKDYASVVRSASVVLDTRGPALVEESFSVLLRPPPGSPLTSVSRATIDTLVRFSFTMSEPIREASVTIEGFEPNCVGPALTFDCSLLYDGSGDDGPVRVTIEAVDRAGNEGSVELPLFEADTVAPDPANTALGLIAYRRSPWGTPTSSVAQFSLRGEAGAVEPGATVIVYNRRDVRIDPLGEPAGEIGRTAPSSPADAEGGFGPIDLIRADLSNVYLVVADAAGNLSDEVPGGPIVEATVVRDGEWTATLSQRGDPNPHRALIARRLVPALEQDPNVAVNADAAQLDALSGAGDPVDVPWAAQWQERRITGDTPVARENHALTYDRRRGRVVLFGGAGSATPQLDDTWEWDGFTWRELLPPVRPDARNRHAMAYDPLRGVTILFGGLDQLDAEEFQDTWTWDGSDWTRLEPATKPLARRAHSMAWDEARGELVMFGGTAGQDDFFDETWIWDGVNWRDAQPVDRPSPRSASQMAYDPIRQRVILFGGYYNTGAPQNQGNDLSDTWEWDGTNWIEVTSSPMTPPPRLAGAMVWSASRGEVMMFGGRDCSSNVAPCGPSFFYGDAWSWDGARWQELALTGDVPPPVDDHAMVEDPDRGQILVLGGGGAAPDSFINTWLEVSPGEWRDVTPTGDQPAARFFGGAAFDEGERRTVFVGGTADPSFFDWSPEAWAWDGWNWTLGESLPAPSENPVVVWDQARDRLVLFACPAGCFSLGPMGSLEVWEREPGQPWVSVTATVAGEPGIRFSPGIAYDSALDQVLLVEGFDPLNGIPINDTWGWDGTMWNMLFAPFDPTPPVTAPTRFQHRTVGDPDRGRVYLLGGMGEFDFIDQETQWEWDGTTSTWTAIVPGGLEIPTSRLDHELVYDSNRRRVIMFGGASDIGIVDEVWTFDGATSWWQRIPVVGNAPSGRTSPLMAYDPDRRRTLVLGGLDGSGITVQDAWELGFDAEDRPGIQLTFAFGQSGELNGAVQGIEVHAMAGGLGFTDDGAGGGTPVDGAEAQLWDAWTGTWRSIGTNDAPRSALAALDAVTTTNAVRHLDGAGRLYLRFQPRQGLGNGPEGGALSLEDVSVTIRYRR